MNTVVHLHVYRAYVLTCASGRTFWKQLQSFEDFQVLARGDITDEERLLASQKAEDQGWRVNPSFSGIFSEKQCAVNVKCIPERSANVHVLTQQKRKEKKERSPSDHAWLSWNRPTSVVRSTWLQERQSRCSPAGLLWQTLAPKLLSDSTSASISKKVNISWGQRSVDAIKPV